MLVDELAHTNIPGTAHEKRWQSVEEILAAGIDVISTVNVQHFESLNDTVFQITGVRVRETLPDSVLDKADEVVLVDLTTDALHQPSATAASSTTSTRSPARSATSSGAATSWPCASWRCARPPRRSTRASRTTSTQHEIETPWATEDRVVVCIKAGPVAKKLVRRGYRLAKRLQGQFWVVHVHTPGETLGRHHDELAELFELARNLGGDVVELERRLRSRRHPQVRPRAQGHVHRHGPVAALAHGGDPARVVADRADHARDARTSTCWPWPTRARSAQATRRTAD